MGVRPHFCLSCGEVMFLGMVVEGQGAAEAVEVQGARVGGSPAWSRSLSEAAFGGVSVSFGELPLQPPLPAHAWQLPAKETKQQDWSGAEQLVPATHIQLATLFSLKPQNVQSLSVGMPRKHRSAGSFSPAAGGGFPACHHELTLISAVLSQVYELGKLPGTYVDGRGPFSCSCSSPGS